MQYVRESHRSAYIPKLLGVYERELAPCIEHIIKRQPRAVVNIGAAEGYYAVGMARRLPGAQITAFEMDGEDRETLRKLARLNCVLGRVTIAGKCESGDLASVLEHASDAVIICDVEGYEEKLLDPSLVPALRRLPILVELHDFLVPNVTELLSERFLATHELTHIWQQDQPTIEFPWRTLGTTVLYSSYLAWAVSEGRPVRMAWFWMTPRQETRS
jgi:hypothetical protein